ncbi:DUF4245 family protein [Brachybacterium sp. ACRRE]|uniref:DUF4245 family protein n=1 Tax=Brachybacterium sp. ACRRE TaxID=2918184 RepID=UPI001EF33CA7|nr:DUF4245 family protein [Brachybacterium sp. ACRRE]MCG7308758.1 DUF4245 domain-containing protein [Brachybacterium sp. ACRRE]
MPTPKDPSAQASEHRPEPVPESAEGAEGAEGVEKEGADATPSSAPAAAPAPAPRKRSPYSMSKGDASMRNIAWALGLTLGCVAVVGVIFFGVGRSVDREIPETSRLDVGASAQRAQEQAPFAVAQPALGSSWTPRAADYTAGDRPTWELRFTSPSNSLVTIVESEEMSAADLSSQLPGADVTGDVTIEGADCQRVSGEDEEHGITCQGDGWAVIVHGAADDGELDTAAKATVRSIEDGGTAGS